MKKVIPEINKRRRRLFDRSYQKLDNGCWQWTALIRRKESYPAFSINHWPYKANRVSYSIYKGEVPINMDVLHTCDNRLCVNPDHLFLGTPKINQIDCVRKGRHPHQKLTIDAVRIIREAIEEGFMLKEIAGYFKVSPHHISSIKNGFSWGHTQ